jgi:threonine dehydratase
MNNNSLLKNKDFTSCEKAPGQNYWVKKEYENITGSAKDRSLFTQILFYYKEGKRDFVISSSGNAGISAAYACQNLGCNLVLYLSHQISQSKKDRMVKFAGNSTKIVYSANPLKECVKFANNTGAVLLRGSIDDIALIGFKDIAYELIEQLPDCTDIFIASSSGTTACGIALGYADKKIKCPRIHIVQTEYVNKLVGGDKKEGRSVAEAIVDNVGYRAKQVREVMSYGWIVPDDQIIANSEELWELGYNCSYEGGLALGGYKMALDKGIKMDVPVIILTGVR